MKYKAKDFFTIPNILSYFRIILIPIFVYKMITAQSSNDYYFAAGIILLSGLTDFADGFIARKFNQITEIGKTIDPVADKLTQFAILVCLMLKIPYMLILVIILVVKELFMGISCLVLLKKNKKLDGALWFGKVSTAVFYVSTFIILAFFPLLSNLAINSLMIISGFFLVLSFVMYAKVFFEMWISTKNDKNS